MSDHDDHGPLLDMLEAAQGAVNVFETATADELEGDLRTHMALRHLIVIVGAAANRISRETTGGASGDSVARPDRSGNGLVHGYDEVDREVVHDTAANYLPRLIAHLRAILGEE